MSNDNMGDRMKEYENSFKTFLPRRLPLIIRCDMRAGHTYTRGFDRPFDPIFHEAMVETAKSLCKQIDGTKLAYTQSDEISLLVTNNDTVETQPWFNNNQQKIVSISAAIASVSFHNAICSTVVNKLEDSINKDIYNKYIAHLSDVIFDSRVFALPEDEIANYFYWRQLDCSRNSVQMVARSVFSHRQLKNKKNDEVKEMLLQKGINWNDYEPWMKSGVTIMKYMVPKNDVLRTEWLPTEGEFNFHAERNKINQLLRPQEDDNKCMYLMKNFSWI